ncbi:MAG: hypothetical protein K2M46_13840 [Lachnospiraceae bacterium]|nr:hypothetical protein [Lachnospiraceae bacterium]
MEERNLDKAIDILTKLMNGEEVGKSFDAALYESYSTNAEVYELVHRILRRMNIQLYEYHDSLYVTAGENNQVFGFTNGDLRKELGLKVNRELYMCYFIIYQIITCFYKDSAGYNFTEYIRIEDVITAVDASLSHIIDNLEILAENETEEHSFKTIALMWNELPAATEEAVRAAKNSKAGYVKLVFNFLVTQQLMAESQERYYLKEKAKAFIEHYFEDNKGRLYQIIKGEEQEDATY